MKVFVLEQAKFTLLPKTQEDASGLGQQTVVQVQKDYMVLTTSKELFYVHRRSYRYISVKNERIN